MTANARVIRGRILSFTDDPAAVGSSAHSLIDDGAVLVAGGLIEAVGEARDILARAPRGAVVDDHAGCIVTAGFIDAHVHYPQTQVIGSYGVQLLDWLNNYTFVEEQNSPTPPIARGSPSSFSTSSPAAARRLRWSIAQSIRNPSTGSSPRPRSAARA